jgi:hypothetical protein
MSMDMDDNKPVTRGELREELVALETRLEDKLMGAMRQIETNILTAFHGYSRGVSAHLHDVDNGQHDLKLRMSALEDRMLNLETRRAQ